MPVRRFAQFAPALLLFSVPFAPAQTGAAPSAPDKAQFQAVESAWDAAVTKRDQYALENVLSSNFVDISATGDVTTRNQQLARLFVQGAEPLSLQQTVITARLFGTVAVVNGTYVMEWPAAGNGAKVAEKGVFTHVFEHGPAGAWHCVNSQRTVVANQAEAPQKQRRNGSQSKNSSPAATHAAPVYTEPGNAAKQPATSVAPNTAPVQPAGSQTKPPQ